MTSDRDGTEPVELDELIAHLAGVRRYLRLTQQEVAERMGTSQDAVSRLERGVGPLRTSRLQPYARALGLRLRFAIEHPTRDGDDTGPEGP